MGEPLDFDYCYRAVQGRDPRFDGWFFTAVTSTGIYCRPSCPAATPKRPNVRFYPTAAAAQQAGFRACLRCRPDAAPGSPEWLGRADVAARAMRLIFDGVVDREGVSGLARRLSYSERQLHRLLVAEVGTGALALARAQRAQTARLLLETTSLPVGQLAFAAGFASIRQFNDTIREVFGRSPSELRRALRTPPSRRRRRAGTGDRRAASPVPRIGLRLAHRQPLAAAELLGFLAARAVDHLEEASATSYRRSLRLPHADALVELTPAGDHVQASFQLEDLRDLATAIARCRQLFNLDADPQAVDRALAEDPVLAPLVAKTPGLRVPGAADGFELAVRAVVGQQVSLRHARGTLRRLVVAAGPPLPHPSGTITHGFPSAAGLGEALRAEPGLPGAPRFPGIPGQRRRALVALADAVASGVLELDVGASPEETQRRLLELPGVGPWTAGYVAMRALGDPDAFLAGDLGARRAAARLGLPQRARGLAAHAARWRPWRSYAQMHLWSAASGQAAPPASPAPAPGEVTDRAEVADRTEERSHPKETAA